MRFQHCLINTIGRAVREFDTFINFFSIIKWTHKAFEHTAQSGTPPLLISNKIRAALMFLEYKW